MDITTKRRSIPPPPVAKLPPLTEWDIRTRTLRTGSTPADRDDDDPVNPGDFE